MARITGKTRMYIGGVEVPGVESVQLGSSDPEMPEPDIEIDYQGPGQIKVLVDGKDITNYVMDLRVDFEPNHLPRVSMTLMPRSIRIKGKNGVYDADVRLLDFEDDGETLKAPRRLKRIRDFIGLVPDEH